MAIIPGLTPNMRFVDPRTGLVTAQAIDFWQQVVTQIQGALTALGEQAAQLAAQQAALAEQEAALTAAVATLTAQQIAITTINGQLVNAAFVNAAQSWTMQQTFDVAPNAPGYDVGSIQVVGAQQPAITPLPGGATLADVITAVNTINTQLTAHGLFA